MKRNISNKLTLIALLALFGCAAKKHIPKPPDSIKVVHDSTVAAVNEPPRSTRPLASPLDRAAIQQHQVDFVTFSAKAKAKLNIDGTANDVTLNIRVQKGQKIWVSVTALLGLEGARALITPDSIKIINRLDATYLKKPFSYLYQYAGSQVSYAALEAMVVGNVWPGLINESTITNMGTDDLTLSGNSGDLIYQLFFGAERRLNKTLISSRGIVARNLQVNDNGAMTVADKIIPAQISISTSAPNSTVNISLTYTKADFNTNPEFPFTVPARYSVVN